MTTRMLASLVGVLALAGCAAAPSAPEATLAIVGATVIHPQRDGAAAVARNQTVLVSGNRIAAVGPASDVKVPAGVAVVPGEGRYVIPGLVDGHVHFFQSGNLYTRPDAADFTKLVPYAKEVERNKERLPATFRVWLASGVTSVVDIGGPMWNFDMRDASRRIIAAPRVAVAGPLVSTIDDPPLDIGDPPIVKTTTRMQTRALVERELERKPDFIKMWFIYRPGDDVAVGERIAKVAADTAHLAGVRFAVHATELAAAKAALRAGADYLVHSVVDEPVDDEFIALARKNHALYCPTIFVFTSYELALSGRWRPTQDEQRLADPRILATMGDLARMPKEAIPERVAKLMAGPRDIKPPPAAMANLRKVWDAGIPVVMGTDAGNIGALHGPAVFREMAIMAQAGLAPLEVLRSATVNGARAMGMERDIGTIEAGKLADLVVLDADPLADVANLSHVYRVVKDGVLYDPDALITSIR
jgi:imidazolonepropionase-like amidohydrolase